MRKSSKKESEAPTSNDMDVENVFNEYRPSTLPEPEKRNPGDVLLVDISGIETRFHWAPPGEFIMGSPKGEGGRRNDEVQHRVRISSGFWMAETETTRGLWLAVMGNDPSWFQALENYGSAFRQATIAQHPSWFQGEGRPLVCPVENVSWDDCQGFIGKINGQFAPNGMTFQLPTEAHWEYACRAGTTTAYSWGDKWDRKKGSANYNPSYPRPVDSFAYANAWGLKDMHGNVDEWCQDWYGDYPEEYVIDPTGPDEGRCRVLRSGAWNGTAREARSACRNHYGSENAGSTVGFRLELSEEFE